MGRRWGLAAVVAGAILGGALLLAFRGGRLAAALPIYLVCAGGLFLAPFLAAAVLRRGGPKAESWRSLALLAGPGAAAGAAGGGLLGGGTMGLLAAATLAGFVLLPLLAVALVGQGLLWRGRAAAVAEEIRGGWRTVLFGGAALQALVVGGMAMQSWETRRAKSWVEDAAAVVRAERARRGELPATWEGLEAALRPPPRFLRGASGAGYSRDRGGEGFTFTFDDGTGLLGGGWRYDGVTGAWSAWVD